MKTGIMFLNMWCLEWVMTLGSHGLDEQELYRSIKLWVFCSNFRHLFTQHCEFHRASTQTVCIHTKNHQMSELLIWTHTNCVVRGLFGYKISPKRAKTTHHVQATITHHRIESNRSLKVRHGEHSMRFDIMYMVLLGWWLCRWWPPWSACKKAPFIHRRRLLYQVMMPSCTKAWKYEVCSNTNR